jgi:predicted membrane-bound spermidine synthase
VIPLVFAVFFASGFAALLYQVIWQRVLVIFSGADVYAATLIVAAFMAGLGLGSLGGGYLADRVDRLRSVKLFGLAELLIALFGFFSTTLYYDVLYQRFGHLPIPAVVLGLILFLSLLWPTLLMGASLPGARVVDRRRDRGAGSTSAQGFPRTAACRLGRRRGHSHCDGSGGRERLVAARLLCRI